MAQLRASTPSHSQLTPRFSPGGVLGPRAQPQGQLSRLQSAAPRQALHEWASKERTGVLRQRDWDDLDD